MCLQNSICVVEAVNMKRPHTDENNIEVFNALCFIKPTFPFFFQKSLSVCQILSFSVKELLLYVITISFQTLLSSGTGLFLPFSEGATLLSITIVIQTIHKKLSVLVEKSAHASSETVLANAVCLTLPYSMETHKIFGD